MPTGLTPHSEITVAFDPPFVSLVEVKGTDASKVLNGLCTAKLADLAIGEATEAFFTDDRGRVLAHVMVARDATSHWIVGQMTDPAALAAHIDRFIFREDAAPRNVTASFHRIVISGSPQSLSQWSGLRAEALEQFGWHTAVIESIETLWLRWPMIEPRITANGHQALGNDSALYPSWLCLVPHDQANEIEKHLKQAGCKFLSPDELETARIAAFWPQTGKEINERTLPQELDRDLQAISFTKGCYLGQETVARLDAMGEVQKKLCLVAFAGSDSIQAGSPLTRDGKEVGKLTSVAPLAVDGSRLALAYMRRGNFAIDTTFEAAGSGGVVRGQVVAHASPSLEARSGRPSSDG